MSHICIVLYELIQTEFNKTDAEVYLAINFIEQLRLILYVKNIIKYCNKENILVIDYLNILK